MSDTKSTVTTLPALWDGNMIPIQHNDKVPRLGLKWKTAQWCPTEDKIEHKKQEENVAYKIGKGHFVLDLDPRNGGSLEELNEYLGVELKPNVSTTGGGHHIYLELQEGQDHLKLTKTVLTKAGLEGIDIKKLGGYVLIPPSKIMQSNGEWGHSTLLYDQVHICTDKIYQKLMPKKRLSQVSLSQASQGTQQREWSPEEIAEGLTYVQIGGEYNSWIEIGQGLHDYGGGSSLWLDIWDRWSATQPSYKGTDDCSKKWNSFNGHGRTIGTVIHHIQAANPSWGKSPTPDKVNDKVNDLLFEAIQVTGMSKEHLKDMFFLGFLCPKRYRSFLREYACNEITTDVFAKLGEKIVCVVPAVSEDGSSARDDLSTYTFTGLNDRTAGVKVFAKPSNKPSEKKGRPVLPSRFDNYLALLLHTYGEYILPSPTTGRDPFAGWRDLIINSEFSNDYGHLLLPLQLGKKLKESSKTHAVIDGADWLPNKSWIHSRKDGAKVINSYSPPILEPWGSPVTEEDPAVAEWLGWFRHFYPENHIDIVCFLVNTLNFNNPKIPYMLVLQGKSGTGKTGCIADIMHDILGSKLCKSIDSETLKEKYNGYLQGTRLVIGTDWEKLSGAEDNKLKPYITDKHILCRHMYSQAHHIRNVANFLAITNSTDFIQTSNEARRYCMLTSSVPPWASEQYTKLFKVLQTKEAKRKIYRYLLDNPHPEEAKKALHVRPVTHGEGALKEHSISRLGTELNKLYSEDPDEALRKPFSLCDDGKTIVTDITAVENWIYRQSLLVKGNPVNPAFRGLKIPNRKELSGILMNELGFSRGSKRENLLPKTRGKTWIYALPKDGVSVDEIGTIKHRGGAIDEPKEDDLKT